jgi:hypothetical protein
MVGSQSLVVSVALAACVNAAGTTIAVCTKANCQGTVYRTWVDTTDDYCEALPLEAKSIRIDSPSSDWYGHRLGFARNCQTATAGDIDIDLSRVPKGGRCYSVGNRIKARIQKKIYDVGGGEKRSIALESATMNGAVLPRAQPLTPDTVYTWPRYFTAGSWCKILALAWVPDDRFNDLTSSIVKALAVRLLGRDGHNAAYDGSRDGTCQIQLSGGAKAYTTWHTPQGGFPPDLISAVFADIAQGLATTVHGFVGYVSFELHEMVSQTSTQRIAEEDWDINGNQFGSK